MENHGAFAMKPMFLFLALAVAAIAFACGDGDESISGPPGQVAIDELTFEEVKERALAALSLPGEVYHSTQTVEGRDYTFTSEVWLDLERDVARVEEGEHRLRIFHEEKIAELSPSGRFQDAAIWHEPGLDKTSALSLGYIATLFARDIESTQLSAAEVEGTPAVLVEVVRPYRGDYTGTSFIQVYLDEAFLPLRLDSRVEVSEIGETWEKSTRFDNEFLDPDSLPENFFSPEAVRALEVTPADDIARAADTGLRPYWLGEHFEEMTLADALETTSVRYGIRVLHLEYRGGEWEPESPGFGVTMSEYTTDDWDRWEAASQRTHWWEQPAALKTPVVVLGAEATLYEGPNVLPPYDVGPEGKPSAWVLVVRLNETVLRIEPNVGDPRNNPYVDDPDALLRLANSMRPFEPAPE